MTLLDAPYDILAALLLVCIALRIADSIVFRNRLRDFAIEPRTLSGLVGVPVAPFLHANWAHLAANIIPVAVLGSLTAYESPRSFALATLAGVGSGLATWLLARSSRHLGASGLAYTYFGYLLAAGYYNRGLILVSLGVWLLFGRLLRGVLPQGKNISFEGHLFGFVAGIAVACYRKQLLGIGLLADIAAWTARHTPNIAQETGELLGALSVCLILAGLVAAKRRR